MSQQSSGTQSSNRSAGMMDNIIRAGQLLFDSRVPMSLKLMLPVGALLYWVWPIDLIPGLPIDDVAVLIGAMALFVKLATDTVERQQRQQRQQAPGQAPVDDTVVDTTWKVVE